MEGISDDEEWNAAVEHVRSNTISDGTRVMYVNCIARFAAWLAINRPDLLSDSYKDGDMTLQEWMSSRNSPPPILINRIKGKTDFEPFLLSLRKDDGNYPGKSVYQTMRSSLTYLFSTYDIQMPLAVAAELTKFYKGLKRTVANRAHRSGDRLTEGKEPFEFACYRRLATSLQQQNRKDCIFAHAFLTPPVRMLTIAV